MDKQKPLKSSPKGRSLDSKGNAQKADKADDNFDSSVSELGAESSSYSADYDDNDPASNSDNFGLDLAVLNEVSKIANMGMSNISFVTNRINDLNMKKELVSMYSQYSNILLQVNQHFEKYGEVPDDSSFSLKMMSFCGIKKNLARDKSVSHIAEMMIQGTVMGVIKCQKILNSNLDVSDSTLQLLKDFNKFQRENIDKLNAFL